MKSFLNYSKNRILYNIFRFLLVFLSVFLLSKCSVKALPTGEYFSESITKRFKLGQFNHGTGSMPLYGFNGTGLSCNTYENPDPFAPLDCWRNGILSLTTPSYDGVVNPANWGIEFFPIYEFKRDYTYTVIITGLASNTTTGLYFSNDKISGVVDADIISSETIYSHPQVQYKVSFKMKEDRTNNLYVLMTQTDINLRDLDDAWAYLFMPDIKLVEDSQGNIIIDTSGIEDKLEGTNNKLENIAEQNKEAETTRKGIWETLKSIPSMIGDALKSLFIPSDDFFEGFINDFMTTLKEKLGFLLYPFEVFIDIINRFLDIPEGDGIIHIPQINDPIYNHKLIEQQDFDIEAIFKTGKIGELHNIYLIFIDFYIIIKLINLALKKFNATFGGGVTE